MTKRPSYKVSLSHKETMLTYDVCDLVSVVVPVYNIEAYVERCVESLLVQTYTNTEIILVDDGSTDSSSDICDRLANEDRRIKVLHKPNGGLSSARNAAFPFVTGTYLTFVDGDDVVSSQYIEALVFALDKDISSLSCVKARSIPDQNVTLKSKQETIDCTEFSQEEALSRILLGTDLTVSAWGKMARKEVWESNPFPEGRVYEDLSVMMKVVGLVDKVISVDAALYGLVFRVGSITRKKFINTRQYLDYHAAISDCCNYVEQAFPGKLKQEILARRLLEYARLGRLWANVIDPDESCIKAHEKARIFLNNEARKCLHNKHIPFSVRVKAYIQVTSPKLYAISFYTLQRLKQRKVR